MITVTNALEGRTYTHHEWVLKDDLSEYRQVFPEFPKDYVQVATPIVVPNGKWIMERPFGRAMLVGITRSESESFRYTDKFGTRYEFIVSDKPFGYVLHDVDYDGEEEYTQIVRKRLVCAHQIHRGELGQTVPILKLHYVRQALDLDESPSIKKRRKHGQRGWVRLRDLAEATGLRPADIIYGFWDFSGHLHWQSGQRVGVKLDIVRAQSEEEIKGSWPEVFSLTKDEVGDLLGGWHDRWYYTDDIWVRRGFAYTVLRLLALGVRSEVNQPV